MEISRRTAGHALVFVLVIVGLTSCNQTPTPSPPVTQNPVPPQPPPNPCKSGGMFKAHCFSIPADTPVLAAGSSIDMQAKTPFQGNTTKYTVTGSNIGSLFFDGIDQFPSSQQFPGWVLRISNRNKHSVEKPDALKICSNKQCDGASLDPNNIIYIKARAGAWLAMPDSTHLVFHDSECDGSSTSANPGMSSQCDFFVKLRVKSQGQPDMVGKCALAGADGICAVGIGRP
jgi:hypothetical protein